MEGKYIVLEGIDGSGKSTQARKLAEYLPNSILTREPTEYNIGKLIRRVLMTYSLSDKLAEGERETLLFFADRIDHHDILIKPTIKSGKNVISDRSYHSTIVYEGLLGVDFEFMQNLVERYTNKEFMKKPDLILIVDTPVEEAIKRMGSKKKEKFEVCGFLENARNIYIDMPKLFPDEKIKIIDGSPEEENVFEDIIKIIKKEFEM